jgi:hypothetical protein
MPPPSVQRETHPSVGTGGVFAACAMIIVTKAD